MHSNIATWRKVTPYLLLTFISTLYFKRTRSNSHDIFAAMHKKFFSHIHCLNVSLYPMEFAEYHHSLFFASITPPLEFLSELKILSK